MLSFLSGLSVAVVNNEKQASVAQQNVFCLCLSNPLLFANEARAKVGGVDRSGVRNENEIVGKWTLMRE